MRVVRVEPGVYVLLPVQRVPVSGVRPADPLEQADEVASACVRLQADQVQGARELHDDAVRDLLGACLCELSDRRSQGSPDSAVD